MAPPKRSRTPVELARYAERRLARALKTARKLAGLRRQGPTAPDWQATVRLVGGPEMVRLNRRYRKTAYATDVLSFGTPEVFFEAGQLGELVICLPTARRQAREQGHTVERELEVLLVHGVLHLLGFDHELSQKEALKMETWERKLGLKAGLIARSQSGT